MDDVVTGASNEEDTFRLYPVSNKILQDGGFNLRKFCTSSPSLQCKIDTTAEMQSEKQPNSHSANLEETYANTMLERPHSSEAPTLKVLGVLWDLHEDCLQFEITDITEMAESTEPTKRIMV